jgi:hypothetical protein
MAKFLVRANARKRGAADALTHKIVFKNDREWVRIMNALDRERSNDATLDVPGVMK